MINILFSKIGEPFHGFVKSRTEERNSKLYVKKDLNIDIDPDILAAFRNSSLVSRKCPKLKQFFWTLLTIFNFDKVTQSATGANLLKVGSKRRRARKEIENENELKSQREKEIEMKMA